MSDHGPHWKVYIIQLAANGRAQVYALVMWGSKPQLIADVCSLESASAILPDNFSEIQIVNDIVAKPENAN